MTTLLTFLIVLVALLILMWNVHPPTRARLRGFSTIIEAAVMAVVGVVTQLTGYYGQIVEALEGTPWRDYVPDNIGALIGYLILVWAIIKRLQTTSPPGEKL